MVRSVTASSPEAAHEVYANRPATAQQLLAFGEVLLLGIWLGSMTFFSFGVAPSAFAVLPTREMAGVIVTSTIGKVEVIGLITGPILILTSALKASGSSAAKILRIVLIGLMVICAALSRFWISPSMVSLRAAMGGHIDDVSPTDPMRVHFNDLHQYSVALMGIAIVAGLISLFLTVQSWLRR
jgi:Domain of unknown function (DUF4149)